MNFFEVISPIAPGCSHLAAIRIFPTEQAFEQGVKKLQMPEDALACCVEENENEDDVLVTLYFCAKTVTPAIVAHEVFHAIMEMAKATKLEVHDDEAQEVLAYGVGQLFNEVLSAIKESKRKK